MVASFAVNAQEQQEQPQQEATTESNSGGEIKAEEGSFSMEVGFIPFGSAPIELEGGQLRGVYSLTENWKLTLGLGFGVHTYEIDGESTTASNYSIAPGVAYEFEGTDRLAPFVGGKLLVAAFNNSDDNEEETSEPSRVSFGFDIVTGFNYYFAEQLYIGAEIGIGFKATSYDDDETASGKDESSAEFETFACPSLILGWTF